jgi:hypothetical protein
MIDRLERLQLKERLELSEFVSGMMESRYKQEKRRERQEQREKRLASGEIVRLVPPEKPTMN